MKLSTAFLGAIVLYMAVHILFWKGNDVPRRNAEYINKRMEVRK